MATQTCNELVYCKRSRKCSKLSGHKGLCNSEKKLITFWEKSPVYITNKRRKEDLDKENRMVETIREYESRTSQVRDQVKELEYTNSELMKNLNDKGKLKVSRHITRAYCSAVLYVPQPVYIFYKCVHNYCSVFMVRSCKCLCFTLHSILFIVYYVCTLFRC